MLEALVAPVCRDVERLLDLNTRRRHARNLTVVGDYHGTLHVNYAQHRATDTVTQTLSSTENLVSAWVKPVCGSRLLCCGRREHAGSPQGPFSPDPLKDCFRPSAEAGGRRTTCHPTSGIREPICLNPNDPRAVCLLGCSLRLAEAQLGPRCGRNTRKMWRQHRPRTWSQSGRPLPGTACHPGIPPPQARSREDQTCCVCCT